MMEKLRKLRSMSHCEITHRLREQVRRESDKLRFHAHRTLDDDSELDDLIQGHDDSLKNYFQRSPARRFYVSIQQREPITNFTLQHHPDWIDRTLKTAEALCDHRVDLFAYRDIYLGPSIDWHRDPITGFQWPRRFWTEYDLVNNPPADAKIIHELNRHQHLPRLAKAFFFTGDESYAREAVAQMESWIEQNSKWQGVNWQSSLEIAVRSISWLWTIILLLPSHALDEQRLRRICRSLFAQLDHVYRYPSIYTSPNTHLIGEAAALFLAGVVFPELPRAQSWRDFGMRTLIDEMPRQVLNDGVYGELSSYYHCYATDFYLHTLILAKQNQIQFPEEVWNTLSRMLEFVMHLTRPDGSVTALGDDDGGRVLAFASENYLSYSDGLCSGCILFNRPDFKYQAGGFCEESLWLLGSAAPPAFKSMPAAPPSDLSVSFKDAGYFIQRSGWSAADTHVTFDCGGLGFGNGGHGHADALAFTMFSGRQPCLIDPGTSAYNCAPAWRRFFRSTAAHNTVVIDGRGQCEPAGTFQWRAKHEARTRKHVRLTDIDYIDGSVSFEDITHRRRLVYVRPNYWIVYDELIGKGSHDYEWLYHFAPEAQLTMMSEEQRGEVECRAQIDGTGVQLSMYGSEAVRAEAICGQVEPLQGWASRLYGDRRASPVLRVGMCGSAPVSMLSFVVPGNQPALSRRFKGSNHHVIATAIRDGSYDDIIVTAVEDGDLHLIDYTMRGEFFWLRTENSNLTRLFAVNAHSFTYMGETVFESKEVIPYVQAYFWDNGILIELGEHEGKVYVRDLRDRQFQRH